MKDQNRNLLGFQIRALPGYLKGGKVRAARAKGERRWLIVEAVRGPKRESRIEDGEAV